MKVLAHYGSTDGSTEGYLLWCPGCGFPHPVDVRHPKRSWTFNGSLTAPTFSPSLLVYGDHELGVKDPTRPRCHSFIRDGRIQFLGDSTHALAGQTVPLPPWRGWDNDEEPTS